MTDLTTADLAQRNDEELAQLHALLARVRAEGRLDDEFSGDARDRSVRDVVAHLLAWNLLFERWYDEGMRGGAPAIPAEGYTWQELDALNVRLRDEWSAAAFDDVVERLDASHDRLQAHLATHADEELRDTTAFAWTQGAALGDYFLENGGNHYRWGREVIADGLAL